MDMKKGLYTGLTHVQCKKFLDFGTTAGKVFFRRSLLFLSILFLFFPIGIPFDLGMAQCRDVSPFK